MSLVSSLLNIFSSFTVSIQNGFSFMPVTKIRNGSAFTDMQIAVNYVNQAGKYFLGQAYGSSSVLSQPSFEEQPEYKPGDTTPPRSFPTYQQNGYEVPLGMNEASMYSASSECYRHIRSFEGLRQRPYYINSQKYIGYGHKLSKDDNTTYISRDQAESYLQSDVSAAAGRVKGAVSGKLSQGQFDALVDFAYTMDGSDFSSSDVVKAVNGGDIPGACTALMQWCYVKQNGVVARNDHLTARRAGNVRWMTMGVDPQPIS
jgi:GH24 family phage-related lysozyme (muramidase)